MTRALRLLVLPVLALQLGGCTVLAAAAILRDAFSSASNVNSVAFAVEDGANQNSPIPVDLVFVSQAPPLIDQIGQMNAADWFQKREQMRRDFPNDIDVVSWEVVPGQVIPAAEIPTPKVRRAAFIFAGYRAPGAHRFRIGEEEDLLVLLTARELRVTAQEFR